MAVKITASMDDQITPAMKKMEKQLAATGKEADEFADDFRKSAQAMGMSAEKVNALEVRVRELGRQSGLTGNQIRHKLLEEMKSRNVSKFKDEIKDLADSMDGLKRKSSGVGTALKGIITGGVVAAGVGKLKEIIKQTEGYKKAAEQMFEAVFGDNSASGHALNEFEKSVARGTAALSYLMGNIDKFAAKNQIIELSTQKQLEAGGMKDVTKIDPDAAFVNAGAGMERWKNRVKAEKEFYKFHEDLDKKEKEKEHARAEHWWQKDAEQANEYLQKEKQAQADYYKFLDDLDKRSKDNREKRLDQLYQKDAEQAAAFEKKLADMRDRRLEADAKKLENYAAKVAMVTGKLFGGDGAAAASPQGGAGGNDLAAGILGDPKLQKKAAAMARLDARKEATRKADVLATKQFQPELDRIGKLYASAEQQAKGQSKDVAESTLGAAAKYRDEQLRDVERMRSRRAAQLAPGLVGKAVRDVTPGQINKKALGLADEGIDRQANIAIRRGDKNAGADAQIAKDALRANQTTAGESQTQTKILNDIRNLLTPKQGRGARNPTNPRQRNSGRAGMG